MNRRKSKHKEKLNIAMFGQKRIPSREGGVEIVVEELCTRMVAQGHNVTCYNRGGHHVKMNWIRYIYQPMVLLQTIRYKDSFIIFVKIQSFLMIAAFLVFIYHDWMPGIKLSGTVHPHITLAVRVVAVCYHLRWCFIRLRDM